MHDWLPEEVSPAWKTDLRLVLTLGHVDLPFPDLYILSDCIPALGSKGKNLAPTCR